MSKYEEFDIAGIYDKSLKYLLAVSLILFSLLHEDISYALGLLLGGVACLVNFKLMIKSLEGMIDKRAYSKAFFNGCYSLRLGLVLAVLVSAIVLESVNLFTAVVGILTIRLVVTWEAFSSNNKRQKSVE